jgi:tRNA U55 pseudouridine synthase TruB
MTLPFFPGAQKIQNKISSSVAFLLACGWDKGGHTGVLLKKAFGVLPLEFGGLFLLREPMVRDGYL